MKMLSKIWAAATGAILTLAACQTSNTTDPAAEAKANAGAIVEGVSGLGVDRNKGVPLPAEVQPVETKIYEENSWEENQKFVVAGMVDNKSGKWQRLFLKVTFKNAAGNPVKVNGEDQVYLPVATSVVPPLGRSTFCWTFDQFAFSEPIKTALVESAGGIPAQPKNLLTAEDISMVSVQSGQASAISQNPDSAKVLNTTAVGSQISCNVLNPFDKTVLKPMTQFVIYGNDSKIWYATVVPIDSSDQMVYASKSGPLAGKEKRVVGVGILHRAMPAGLQKVGIHRVEFLPFDATE